MDFAEFCPFHEEEESCSTVFLSATRFVRKMTGGSQSILVQCSDGKYYVVKMTDNPQGGNTLANEVLGAIVIGAVGLATAENRIIYLSDSFIGNELGPCFNLHFGKRPSAGLHFGSLFIGHLSGLDRSSDYISRSRINTISNRDAFLGMYILDVWANHQDHRQAVFLRRPDGTQQAIFIDHGLMFGGRNWNFYERPGCALHLEKTLYLGLWHDEAVAAWISHFRIVLPGVLRSLVSFVPPRWYKGNLDFLVNELFHRLQNLEELVQTDAVKLQQFILHHSENDILPLSDFGIHEFRTPGTWGALYRELEALRGSFLFAEELCLEGVEN